MSDIKVITEPTVRLVGRQTIDEVALNDFLKDEGAESWTTDTDIAAQKVVEVAGRLCYQSYAKPRPGGNAAYLAHILEVGHGSVLEHAIFNFIITGVSRSLTHELVRHRAGWAYSQRSQRFCDESELSVVVPPALLSHKEEWESHVRVYEKFRVDADNYYFNPTTHGLAGEPIAPQPSRRAITYNDWLLAATRCRDTYGSISDGLMEDFSHIENKTLRRKMARQAARSVLPNATATEIFVTANARALRTFLEQRGDRSADAEIRRLALTMLAILQEEAFNLFGDYRVEGDEVTGRFITTDHRKV